MREGDQSSREQMGPLVCMSLEEIESSVSTAMAAVFLTYQECGGVIFPILMRRYTASTLTLAIMQYLVRTVCCVLQ